MTFIEMGELLGEQPFLRGLSQEWIDEIEGCSQNVAFTAGRLLMAEGEPATTFYLVRRGRVAIEAHSPDRGALTIETVGPGQVVGWSWLVPPYRWTFDARALEPVGAIAIDGACLRSKADAEPALGYALLQRVSGILLERLQGTRARLLDLYGS